LKLFEILGSFRQNTVRPPDALGSFRQNVVRPTPNGTFVMAGHDGGERTNPDVGNLPLRFLPSIKVASLDSLRGFPS